MVLTGPGPVVDQAKVLATYRRGQEVYLLVTHLFPLSCPCAIPIVK